ncbi:MAG: lipopolysaccharide kinase InaA family protein, partial [Thermoanaerobaculia bacterium]
LRARGQSKAAKSFRMARAFAAAGLSTPEALLFAEAQSGPPTAIFVTCFLAGRVELRYLLRARNAGSDRESFPQIDGAAAIAAVASYARRMHDAGFFHRDFSIGNLLLAAGSDAHQIADVAIVDLNRCRKLSSVGAADRMRDLCRLPLDRTDDRDLLLRSYFAPEAVPGSARRSYELARRSFLAKVRGKAWLRGALAKVKSWLVPRGTHAHIPPPPEAAEIRDRAVWDRLSDQPHQHAGRLARARIRLADLPKHLRAGGALAAALPRIRRRYRKLSAEQLHGRAPFPWPEPGIALRPWPEDPAALLAVFDRSGARRATIRLHPWQERHDDEEELARALAGRGVELAFVLPQNRELVRDPARWEAAIRELATRFRPFGRRFQVGQAINRSKWGIWNYEEYLGLAARAAGILRAGAGGEDVELFGPAVIDFEAHVTAAVVNLRPPANLPELRFDGLASLLYVDRRGAPENLQLGFDTADKVRVLAAIAGTSRLICSARQWIPEVNWPLREGPHSPAGKSVAVDEEAQADFLVRYYLLAAGTGLVERIDWWQLVAKGYGLCDPQPDGTLRERPSFRALATLIRELAGTICHGALPAGELPSGGRAMRFTRSARGAGATGAIRAGTAEGSAGEEIIVAWSTVGGLDWTPAAPPRRIVDRDGKDVAPGGGAERLVSSPRYFIGPCG